MPAFGQVGPSEIRVCQNEIPCSLQSTMNVNDAGKVVAERQGRRAKDVGKLAEQSFCGSLEMKVEVRGDQSDPVRRPKQPQYVVMQRIWGASCGRK